MEFSHKRTKIIKKQLATFDNNEEHAIDKERYLDSYIRDPSTSFNAGSDTIILYFEISGTEETPWEGLKYKCKLEFPQNYPNSPPEAFFITRIEHPNVYRCRMDNDDDSDESDSDEEKEKDQEVCISILHDSGDDMSDEPLEIQWSAAQTIPNIIMSIRALFDAPFCDSPANVDAKLLYENDVKKLKEKNQRINKYNGMLLR